MGNPHSADLSGLIALVDDLETRLTAARATKIDNLDMAVSALNDLSETNVVDIVKRLSLANGLTVAIFQTTPATGTTVTPDNLNDDDVDTYASADTIGEYIDVDLGAVYIFKQYRQAGSNINNGTGRWFLQRKVADTWEDIVEIPAKAGVGFGDWVEIPAATSQYIRLICTVVDDAADCSHIAQLELKY